MERFSTSLDDAADGKGLRGGTVGGAEAAILDAAGVKAAADLAAAGVRGTAGAGALWHSSLFFCSALDMACIASGASCSHGLSA